MVVTKIVGAGIY